MNKLQNTVTLIGRSGIEPVIRNFANGVKLAKFSLATNETVVEPDGKSVKTQWHQIVAWGKKAELIEKYVKKGQLMAVDGRLINRVYIDDSGTSKKLTEIQVNEILLINPEKANDPAPVTRKLTAVKVKPISKGKKAA